MRLVLKGLFVLLLSLSLSVCSDVNVQRDATSNFLFNVLTYTHTVAFLIIIITNNKNPSTACSIPDNGESCQYSLFSIESEQTSNVNQYKYT